MEKIDPITETAPEESVSAPKPKRAYKKKEAAPSPLSQTEVKPAAPTPAMLALEADILKIVQQRDSANQALRAARSAMETAQIQMKNAQEYLMEVEREVNYRMALIGQLRGDKPTLAITQNAPNFGFMQDSPMSYTGSNVSSVSSIPPAHEQTNFEVVGGRRVRSEAADRAML